MIPVPSGVRIWLAAGTTDMRRGMNSLALQVQQALGRDPHGGDLYIFRGCRADLVKIFELAQLARAPLAAEAVRRIDAIFDAERTINGLPVDQRLAVRQKHVAPLVEALEAWMHAARGKMSRHADVAKAMDYMLKRWDTFSRFTTNGRICLTNNAAERALRGVALGRKVWLFAGSDRGGERAAAMYSLLVTAKLNDTDPRAWLADVLRRINDHPASRLHELLPWHWRKPGHDTAAAA